MRLFNRLLSFALVAIALVSVAPLAKAQTYGTNLVPMILTPQAVAGSSATNINSIIDITKEKYVSIALKFAPDAASTATCTAFFAPALDSSTNFMDNTKGFSLVGTAVSSGAVVLVTTNLTQDMVGGYGYLVLRYVTNAAAAGNVTNVSVTYGIKKNAP